MNSTPAAPVQPEADNARRTAPRRPAAPGMPDSPSLPPQIISPPETRPVERETAALPAGPSRPSLPGLPDEPPAPVEPINPVDPINPVNPIDPINRVDPVDPGTPPEPLKPVISGLYDRNSGDRPIDNHGVSFDSEAKLKGTGEPFSFVAILDARQQLLGYARVNAEGNWSHTLRQGLTGEQSLSVSAVDPNTMQPVGEPSNAVDFTLYHMNIELIFANGVADSGMLQDGDRTEDSTPLIAGTSTPGAIIVIRDNGNLLHSFQVNENGHWSFTPSTPLENGERELTFSVLDKHGNEHQSDSTFTLIIDAPVEETPEPVLPEPGPTIDGIYDNRDGLKPIEKEGVSFDTTPVLKGTGEPSSLVAIFYGDHRMSGVAWVDAQGNWSYTPQEPLTGEQRFYAQALDMRTGETVGAPGNPVDITFYEVKINLAYDNVGAERGFLENGAHTDDTTPQIFGYATPDTVIVVRDNGNLLHSFKVNDSGNWSFTPTLPLSGGQHELTFNLKESNGVEHSSDVQFTLHIDAPSTRAFDALLTEGETLLFTEPQPAFDERQPDAPMAYAPAPSSAIDDWDNQPPGF